MKLSRFNRVREWFNQPVLKAISAAKPISKTVVEQHVLLRMYEEAYRNGAQPIPLSDTGFRIHSQHEEDGLLLFIFALIGVKTKKCVEVCAGNGMECNTANLILNHRWLAALFDGNPENIRLAERFYTTHPDSLFWPPRIQQAWITRENVNELITAQGFSGEVDLFSLDIDGVDYWIWEALTCIDPRVVILEFNHLCGPERAVTVPYSDDFKAEFSRDGTDYAGASLAAFVALGKRKGYRLVGSNAIGTNALFVRKDIECAWLPEVTVESCFRHPRIAYGIASRWPKVKEMPWESV